MARIQFSRGIDEPVAPEVRLTRNKDGSKGTATFVFDQPVSLVGQEDVEITGMYLIDEEGEIVSKAVNAKFINGRPAALEVLHVMKSAQEWDRFMRFMERYAEENQLGLSKNDDNETPESEA